MKALQLSSSKYTQLLLNMPVLPHFLAHLPNMLSMARKKQREVHPICHDHVSILPHFHPLGYQHDIALVLQKETGLGLSHWSVLPGDELPSSLPLFKRSGIAKLALNE